MPRALVVTVIAKAVLLQRSLPWSSRNFAHLFLGYERAAAESQHMPLRTAWDRHKGEKYKAAILRILQDAAREGPRVCVVHVLWFVDREVLTSNLKIAFALNALLPISPFLLPPLTHQAGRSRRLCSSLQSQIASIKTLYAIYRLPNLVNDGCKALSCGGKGVSVEFEVHLLLKGSPLVTIESRVRGFQIPKTRYLGD